MPNGKRFISFIALNSLILLAPMSICGDAEEDYRIWTQNREDTRSTGKGSFITTWVYRYIDPKTLSQEMSLLEGIERKMFKSECEAAGVSFDREGDVREYRYDKVVFSENKGRIESAYISANEVQNIFDNPSVHPSLDYLLTIDDGRKCVCYRPAAPNGKPLVVSVRQGNSLDRSFRKYGLFEGSDNAATSSWQRIDSGKSILKGRREGQMTYISVLDPNKDPTLSSSLEVVLERGEQLVCRKVAFSRGGHVRSEREHSEFFLTASGDWFPRRRERRTYIILNGKEVCAREEIVEALPGSVDFNMPVDDSMFHISLPIGSILHDATGSGRKDTILTGMDPDVDIDVDVDVLSVSSHDGPLSSVDSPSGSELVITPDMEPSIDGIADGEKQDNPDDRPSPQSDESSDQHYSRVAMAAIVMVLLLGAAIFAKRRLRGRKQ